jgi:SAM-dependent methyltransferase
MARFLGSRPRGGRLVDVRALVCPICKGPLEVAARDIYCGACRCRYPQASADYLDLLPEGLVELDHDWRQRQAEMEEWYRHLVADPHRAVGCLNQDYGAFAELLGGLRGSVLDVGGGVGITRSFLPPDASYTVLDPSLEWLGEGWRDIAPSFPALSTKPDFVRGVAEYLPFATGAYDVVLSFWTLNHVSRLDMALEETHRVLAAGGRFILVLEDMRPRWRDIFSEPFRELPVAERGRLAAAKLLSHLRLRRWPRQSDHLAIDESRLLQLTSALFSVRDRYWARGYLTFDLRRI